MREIQGLMTELPLYVSRPLMNAQQVVDWYTAQGVPRDRFGSLAKMHTTLAYSKTPVLWNDQTPDHNSLTIEVSGESTQRWNRVFGPAETIGVLQFETNVLRDRWSELCQVGAVWDYPEFNPHVSLFTATADVLVRYRELPPYLGPLEFGPERWEVIHNL